MVRFEDEQLDYMLPQFIHGIRKEVERLHDLYINVSKLSQADLKRMRLAKKIILTICVL